MHKDQTTRMQMDCTATLEFGRLRLSMLDRESGEGMSMYMQPEAMGALMRELRRVQRQMRQSGMIAQGQRIRRDRAHRAPRQRPTATDVTNQ